MVVSNEAELFPMSGHSDRGILLTSMWVRVDRTSNVVGYSRRRSLTTSRQLNRRASVGGSAILFTIAAGLGTGVVAKAQPNQ
jgi:hypothetical protein